MESCARLSDILNFELKLTSDFGTALGVVGSGVTFTFVEKKCVAVLSVSEERVV